MVHWFYRSRLIPDGDHNTWGGPGQQSIAWTHIPKPYRDMWLRGTKCPSASPNAVPCWIVHCIWALGFQGLGSDSAIGFRVEVAWGLKGSGFRMSCVSFWSRLDARGYGARKKSPVQMLCSICLQCKGGGVMGLSRRKPL